jgi:hypothetical protein
MSKFWCIVGRKKNFEGRGRNDVGTYLYPSAMVRRDVCSCVNEKREAMFLMHESVIGLS